jgi:hypothetical protein
MSAYLIGLVEITSRQIIINLVPIEQTHSNLNFNPIQVLNVERVNNNLIDIVSGSSSEIQQFLEPQMVVKLNKLKVVLNFK